MLILNKENTLYLTCIIKNVNGYNVVWLMRKSKRLRYREPHTNLSWFTLNFVLLPVLIPCEIFPYFAEENVLSSHIYNIFFRSQIDLIIHTVLSKP